MKRAVLFVVLLILFRPQLGLSDSIITFDELFDGDVVTNQFAGLSFTNATVFTAGVSLNELELPPRSGTNVAFDNGGPIRIDFDSAVAAFSGYFTYLEGLSLQAFDGSNNLLGGVSSLFSANVVSSGDPPNELISLSFAGIRSITITGDSAGGSFVMDDLTITPDTTTGLTPVPEPSTLSLIALGCAIIVIIQYRRNRPSLQ